MQASANKDERTIYFNVNGQYQIRSLIKKYSKFNKSFVKIVLN